MPITSRPELRASIVTDEMTLLMPGAGPPPTKMARRGRARAAPLVRDIAMLVILGTLPPYRVSPSLTSQQVYLRNRSTAVYIEALGGGTAQCTSSNSVIPSPWGEGFMTLS